MYKLADMIKRSRDKKEESFKIWESWKKNPSAENLENLYKQVDSTIGYNINKWRTSRVPTSSLKVEAERLSMQAFKSFNPEKSSLNTFVDRWLTKLNGFAQTHSQSMKIPENRIHQIKKFQEAEDFLESKKGLRPSESEIADYLSIPVQEVKRFRKEAFKVIGDSYNDPGFSQIGLSESRPIYALNMVYTDLNRNEKKVFNHLYGKHGKKEILSTQDIAKEIGLSNSKVSRLKKSIAKKVERYL